MAPQGEATALLTVRVSRSGGIAGLRMRWAAAITDPGDAERWDALIAGCPWGQVQGGEAQSGDAQSGDAPGADRFSYDIAVEDLRPGARAGSRTARVPESGVRGPWQVLIDRVRAAAGA